MSALDSEGRTIWIIDAHFDGKRFVVCANEKLIAFLKLEAAIKIHSFGPAVRITPIGDISLKNQGLSPIGRQAARITFSLSCEPQNCDVLAMCRAASCTD